MMIRDKIHKCLGGFIVTVVYVHLKIQNALINALCAMLWPVNRGVIKTICIHRVGQIGDIVCALPAMSLLHQKWPQSKIVVLTSAGFLKTSPLIDLVKGIPWISAIETYDSASIQNSKNFVGLIKSLRNYKIDVWVELPQDLTNISTEIRNMLFAKIIGAGYGFGFGVNTSKLFSRYQLKFGNFKHETDTLLDIVEPLRLRDQKKQYGFEYSLVDSLSLPLNFSSNPEKIMVIAPGANRRANRWPIDRFATIALRWFRGGGIIVVVGGPQDRELGEEIKNSIDSKSFINLCGETDLAETICLLSKAKILVTNDSGPMHLASVAKTPVVAIFSARDFPLKWSPCSNLNQVLRVNTDCSPCFKDECDRDNLCLSLVTVDDVWCSVKNIVKTYN